MDTIQSAADLLLLAHSPTQRLARWPDGLAPRDAATAYAIQHAVAAALGPIGGWKVGAAGPDAAPSCAPMPASGISEHPGRLPRGGVDNAVEAEIAFRLGRDLPPRETPYDRAEIIAALSTAHPAIEWLASRFADPAAMDPLSLLADSQTHGGFIWGPGIAAWQAIDFAAETVTQDVGGVVVRRIGNPAGDMIRLVQYLANEGAVWAGGPRAGQFVTCGSWTGKTPIRSGQTATVRFPSVGMVELA